MTDMQQPRTLSKDGAEIDVEDFDENWAYIKLNVAGATMLPNKIGIMSTEIPLVIDALMQSQAGQKWAQAIRGLILLRAAVAHEHEMERS